MTRFVRRIATAAFTCLSVLGSSSLVRAEIDDSCSGWSAPINLGSPVNTAAGEQAAFIAKKGLSLYFTSNRPGGLGGTDIWVSQRASVDEPWGEPQNLGAPINSTSNEFAPSLTIDGHTLFFQSNRPGGFGALDLYMSRRRDKRDDFDWREPVNLGGAINTTANEEHPAYFEDEATGVVTLFFTSNRLGGDDIHASTLQADGTFGPAEPVEELNTAFIDRQPAIRRDGLEMFLTSDRPGTQGGARPVGVHPRDHFRVLVHAGEPRRRRQFRLH